MSSSRLPATRSGFSAMMGTAHRALVRIISAIRIGRVCCPWREVARRVEHTYQMGSYANQIVLIVKLHVEAGGAAPDDLALLVQSGRQCPVDLVYRNLLDSVVARNLGAVGVEPGVVGGSGWHGEVTSGAG